MDFRYVGHASILATTKDFTLLTDPWFGEPLNYGAFRAYPPIIPLTPAEIADIDAIHISHLHRDHFCPATLAHFRSDIPILIGKYENLAMKTKLNELGFYNIIEVPPGLGGVEIGGIKVYSFLPDEFDGSFDSALVLQENLEKYFINNDCILSDATYRLMRDHFQTFAGCFLGYCHFKPFPSCYDLSSCQTPLPFATQAAALNSQHEESWKHFENILRIFKPRWVAPYANGIRFLNRDFLHHNVIFNKISGVQMVDLYGSQLLVIKPGDLISSAELQNFSREGLAEDLSAIHAEALLPALFPNEISREALTEKTPLYENFFLNSLSKESRNWADPMTIRIVLGGSSADLVLHYHFDGTHITKKELPPDLVITYPASMIDDVLEGRMSSRELHFAYRFKVQFLNYNPKQMRTLTWRL